jgi:putative transposase
MNTKRYPSDLTDREWGRLEGLIPAVKRGGRPASYTRREIVNGILYVLRSGCSWRMLPKDLPPWDLVFGYFNRWRKNGVWQAAHDQLYGQMRQQMGRLPQASAAVADSQSTKTTEKGAKRL